jgi:hypothetical protein
VVMTFEDICFSGRLAGIAEYGTTSNKVLVKIVNPSGSGADIFVAFNAKKGINSGTLEAGNQVTVVQVGEGGGASYSESKLLSKLSAGGSYINSNFGGKQLTVQAESISVVAGFEYYANVKIYFGSSCTAAPPTPAPIPSPPPTQIPTNVSPSGPQTAIYDPTLKAPKCSFGSSCDSGTLLNGRGTIANGNEPNQPNTLNSCVDGNNGSYHGDESIDKIVVSRASGGVGDLTVGELVTITATVWCWSTGTSDYIDFYYANDATNPVWNQIGLRQTCPGGGLQTVTASYTLPQGAIQAVRVNLMYGSNTPTAAKCVSGSYDDVDDLVITVKPNIPGTPTSPPTNVPTALPTALPTSKAPVSYEVSSRTVWLTSYDTFAYHLFLFVSVLLL